MASLGPTSVRRYVGHALSLAAIVTVFGCARHGLSVGDAASLIKRYRTDHCRVQELTVEPKDIAKRGTGNVAVSLLPGTPFERKVHAYVKSSFGTFTTESLRYQDDDATETVALTQIHYPDTPWADRIVSRACLFRPTKVEVSDLVFESSKTANALFTEHVGLSLLARNLQRDHMLGDMTGAAPSEAHGFHMRLATLIFDDRDGWIVSSIANGG